MRDSNRDVVAPPVVSVLPGPVRISDAVRAAFAQAPISHRSERFTEVLHATREALCSLVQAGNAALLMGSGTLANDVVAAQLTRLKAPGLIVVTGEFGARLTDHAHRFGLVFDEVRAPWGEAVPLDSVRRVLDGNSQARWLWVVHCETSTGVLHDMEDLQVIARDHDLRLCVDAVSTIGAVPVDLTGVYLATGVSGKGLAAYPGLAMVFHHHAVKPSTTLPRYLDLGLYAQSEGVPFTASSNLLFALNCSLERFATPERSACEFESRRQLAAWLRAALEARGFAITASAPVASPAVFTIELPQGVCSRELGDHLARRGFLVSYQSAYLLDHNVIQICLMGEVARADLGALVDVMCGYLAQHGVPPSIHERPMVGRVETY